MRALQSFRQEGHEDDGDLNKGSPASSLYTQMERRGEEIDDHVRHSADNRTPVLVAS